MATNQIHHGQQLKEYLGAKGINLSDLAKKLGTKRQYFYRWFLLKTLDKALLDKLTLVTGFVVTDMPDITSQSDLEKEIIRLKEIIDSKNKVIDAQMGNYISVGTKRFKYSKRRLRSPSLNFLSFTIPLHISKSYHCAWVWSKPL